MTTTCDFNFNFNIRRQRQQPSDLLIKFVIFNFLALLFFINISTSKEIAQPYPPPVLTEKWHRHKVNVTRAQFDEHVAFYFDANSNFSKTTENSSIFSRVSKAWQYVKRDYKISPADSYLLVILHSRFDEISTRFSSTILTEFPNTYVIDCGRRKNSALTSLELTEVSEVDTENSDQKFCDIDSLIQNIAQIVFAGNSSAHNGYGNAVIAALQRWKLFDLITYDIYTGINETGKAQYTAEEAMESSADFPQDGVNLFCDWYLPIYERHGHHAVQDFISIAYLNLDILRGKEENGGKFEINPGQFVHMWSGAAKSDMRDLAHRAFGWTDVYKREFETAQAQMSQCNYTETFPDMNFYTPPLLWKETWDDHDKNITLDEYHNDLALYKDHNDPHVSNIPPLEFKFLSEAWLYAKTTYGPFSPDPRLYIVLHEKSSLTPAIGNGSTTRHFKCRHSKTISYLDKDYDGRIVIDCTLSGNSSQFSSPTMSSYLLEEMAGMIQRVSKETGFWPAGSVTRWEMSSILVYDIYIGLEKPVEASEWTDIQWRRSANFPQNDTFWLRDWYYPIYDRYGGARVLNEFFNLLYTHWPREGTDYTKHMNLGEFVYFWSEAARAIAGAGVDLTDLARKAFNFTIQNAEEFNKAKLKYGISDTSDSGFHIFSTGTDWVFGIGTAIVVTVLVILALVRYGNFRMFKCWCWFKHSAVPTEESNELIEGIAFSEYPDPDPAEDRLMGPDAGL